MNLSRAFFPAFAAACAFGCADLLGADFEHPMGSRAAAADPASAANGACGGVSKDDAGPLGAKDAACAGRDGAAASEDAPAADAPSSEIVETDGATAFTATTGPQITAGSAHACMIVSGGVRCWGRNGKGALGMGNTSPVTGAPLVPGLTNVVALAAGGDHTCALLANKTVTCFGANDHGQLGDGTQTARPTPTIVAGLANVTAIAAGENHTCAALASGTVSCWGDNSSGQISGDPASNLLVPTAIASLSGVASVGCGRAHSCAMLQAGGVRCWGDNEYGQLGDGTLNDSATPVAVAGLPTAVRIGIGADASCAILANGGARCWGYGADGQLGNAVKGNSAAPVEVVRGSSNEPMNGVLQLVVGWTHTCARRANDVRCWGVNFAGVLGNGTEDDSLYPEQTLTLGSTTVEIAAGYYHTCARLSNGTAKCWGVNDEGQLGTSVALQSCAPETDAGPATPCAKTPAVVQF